MGRWYLPTIFFTTQFVSHKTEDKLKVLSSTIHEGSTDTYKHVTFMERMMSNRGDPRNAQIQINIR